MNEKQEEKQLWSHSFLRGADSLNCLFCSEVPLVELLKLQDSQPKFQTCQIHLMVREPSKYML